MTSINWLIEKLIEHGDLQENWRSKQFCEEAKEMHKQEIIDTYQQGTKDGYEPNYGDGKQYYQETFVSKGNDLEQVVNDYDDDPTWIDDEAQLPQQEISDEEIKKAANNPVNDAYSFIERARWYAEQLKTKI
jgi:hypothetical protein